MSSPDPEESRELAGIAGFSLSLRSQIGRALGSLRSKAEAQRANVETQQEELADTENILGAVEAIFTSQHQLLEDLKLGAQTVLEVVGKFETQVEEQETALRELLTKEDG